ncbi:MAG: hypothetical protein HWN68_08940 [Desulfobacterales bacterium]|nr:hypothetical protein [Desulfobacterales bacterium]
MKGSIINPDFYVYRERSAGEILPWDFIDHGINKAFLVQEYQKTLAEKKIPCVRCRSLQGLRCVQVIRLAGHAR